MVVNPSINISIGDYGEKYLTSLGNYFKKHEQEFNKLASFNYIYWRENKVSIISDSNDYNKNINLFSAVNNTEADLKKQINSEKIADSFKNFINTSYNQIVNLSNQRVALENCIINLNLINYNVIISGFEASNSILFELLVNKIKDLNDRGLIQGVSVKLFVILPKYDNPLTKEEQIASYQLLSDIKAIQENTSDVFHNIIFIDEKNTNTISLGINEKSIGFTLNEFITYLMTNHYDMIGNLMNSKFISMGLGTLYFDYSYFKAFFRHKTMSKHMSNEGFNQNNSNPIDSIRAISDILKTSIQNKEKPSDIIEKIGRKIENVENKNNSLLEYKYILAAILGKFNDCPGSNKIRNTSKISFYDLIFSFVSDFLLLAEDVGSTITIMGHKKLLDDIEDLKSEFDNLKKKNINGSYDTKIGDVNAEIATKSELADKQSKIIKQALEDFRDLKYEDKIKIEIIPKLEKQIEELNFKKEEFQKEKVSFVQKLINLLPSKSRKKKERIESFNNDINELENKKQQIDSLYNKSYKDSQPLYKFIRSLEKKYAILSNSIDNCKKIGDEFEKDFNKKRLLDYSFVRNIIDEKTLEEYFNMHQVNFLDPLDKLSTEVSKLFNDIDHSSKFIKLIYSKIDNKIQSIVAGFNILNYLNGDYDKEKLFIQVNLQNIITDLKELSIPFINTDPKHNTKNSHVMKLHNNFDQKQVDKLDANLSSLFQADIPQEINTLHKDKFSIIKIDLITDLDHLVKYNLYKNTCLEKNNIFRKK